MSKFVGLSLSILIMLIAATTTQERFAKYRKVEAYEVRPGILAMPRYTAHGEVCEIGLERLLYSPKLIRTDASLSREEVYQIFDELVPAVERGKPTDALGDLVIQTGNTMTTSTEFENVLIQTYGATLRSSHKNEITVNEVVATVKWKQRVCR
jgi:hypothetical protein